METKNLSSVNIGLVNISDLKQHEYALDEHIEELKQKIIMEKIIRKPIIADINTGTIIDGAHRTRALKSLNVKYIPAILIDYLNYNEMYVDKWIRIYYFDNQSEIITDLKSIFCFDNIEHNHKSTKIKLCDDNKIDAYMQINKFENEYKELIKGIYFSKSPLKQNKRNGIIIDPPKLDKNDVIYVALKQMLLPPRSTRHISLLKKIYINFSLKDLY
ncbi:putative transcriptional regulator [Caldisphaera lagunensis DSM 15908]|uniref:Putative transcriptional regulator n=1 Tax=Caldisphaera lagunensis (strain DSM 15908 / JCM 11604 / ANMR 0165 / IC-154) TaxID=1056495 RepID=L0A8Y9_CALLD|nr:ParB N-terminal domain-containing protein [Caldisphaera lagunensis]AFZ70353.1 putative transcriptional regulator [Caldisphaera lagunensis DSM 15908]